MSRAGGPAREPRHRPGPVTEPSAAADEAGGRDPSYLEERDERLVEGGGPFALEVRGVEPGPDGRIWGPYVL
jgi:hypothetical protein